MIDHSEESYRDRAPIGLRVAFARPCCSESRSVSLTDFQDLQNALDDRDRREMFASHIIRFIYKDYYHANPFQISVWLRGVERSTSGLACQTFNSIGFFAPDSIEC